MTDQAQGRFKRLRLSLDTWAVMAAAGFVLAICLGTLPRIPW